MLISDGLATSGITDLDQIAGLAKRATTQGITVSALGLGVKFDGDLLYALSDAGGGSYLYAGRSAALAETIDAELERTFQVAAQSARVEVSFHPDVQLSQAYGYEAWDGEVTDNGFEAFLGDLHANQTRKVVLRVKPPTALAGELNLASIRVTWRDPESGETRTRTERVSLTLTQDNALVEASRVDWATVHASQASVGQSMQRANASWRAGNTEQATGILEQAQRKLARIRALVDAPALSQLDQGLSEQTQRYEQVELNSWEGLDLAAAESLRALGYVE